MATAHLLTTCGATAGASTWRVRQAVTSHRWPVARSPRPVNPLLLDGTFQAGDTVHIGVAEDRLKFR
jgi:hypothetical protein